MKKPSTVAYEEFKQNVADLINNSGLPIFIVEAVLQNYLNEARVIARNQYEADKAEYEEFLRKGSANQEQDLGV